jgi:DNA-binding IclR family transcriptional regulator
MILDELRNVAPYGLKPAEIINRTGMVKNTVWTALRRMANKGEVVQEGYDYFHPELSNVGDVDAFSKD